MYANNFRITNHKKQRLAHNKVSIYLQVYWFFNQRFCHFIVTHLNNNDSGSIIFVDHNRHGAEHYHLYLHVYHVFSLSYVFFHI